MLAETRPRLICMLSIGGMVCSLAVSIPGCGASASLRSIVEDALEVCEGVCECNDGIDNDGDGLVDYVFDQGCSARNDVTEGGLATGSREGGWTVFEPSLDTRIIYVSSSLGDDAWDGLAPAHESGAHGPKQTIGAALDELRSGFPDWMLLRRGDEWNGGFGVSRSGRSATEPLLISSYGEEIERPIVHGSATIGGDSGVSNVAIAHLDFFGHFGASSGENVLLEGCRFQETDGAIYLSDARSFALRRNVAVRTNDNAIYVTSTEGLLIEENVVYRPAVEASSNHAFYITRIGNSGIVARRNLVLLGKPQGDAIMMRAGGIAEENVVADVGWNGITMGKCNDEGGPDFGPCLPPVQATVTRNLIVERHGPIGCGVSFVDEFIASGTTTDNATADDGDGITCEAVQGAPNVVESGTLHLTGPADPERPDATFLGAVSARNGRAATTEEFFAVAIEQRKFSYRPEYSAIAVIDLFWSLRE